MPPTASLTDAGLTMLHGASGNNDASSSSDAANGNEQHVVSPSYRAPDHQASSSLPIPSPPAEVEATLSKLTSHANVAGVLVLSRPEALVIRSGGAFFDPSGPGASDRAVRLKAVVEMVRNAVQGLERDVPKTEMGVRTVVCLPDDQSLTSYYLFQDELSFLRIRTKKYEMMISPSEKYLLVVIQDPTL
jgi:dynein light chain roadblock-type